jgi:hypothetical protein
MVEQSLPPPVSAPSSYGWSGTVATFLTTSEPDWLGQLRAHHLSSIRTALGEAQLLAWRDCFHVLSRQLHVLVNERPEAGSWPLTFEYELPRERGRRPDVVIMANATIVLEFKRASSPRQSAIDQVATYARDLRSYHAGSRDHHVVPVLVLTKAVAVSEQRDGVMVSSGNELASVLSSVDTAGDPIDASTWLAADYEPLPALVRAARMIFQHEPLPQIRRAQSAGSMSPS